MTKIYQKFVKDDAELIVSISVLKEPADDQLFWHYDKQINYYAKSRFQIAKKIRFASSPSGSRTNSEIWKALWNFTLPTKVKNFLWRAVQNLLPTTKNLWHKKIVVDLICQIYKRQVENISHALFTCKMLRKIWNSVLFARKILDVIEHPMMCVMQDVAGRLKRADIELLIAICWVVWHARNLLIF